ARGERLGGRARRARAHAGLRPRRRSGTLSHAARGRALSYTFAPMTPKLGLDPERIARCRTLARGVADGVRRETEPYTTVSTERTVLRLLGVDGVDAEEVPVPNRVVGALSEAGRLSRGAAVWMGSALAAGAGSASEASARLSDPAAAAAVREHP